MTEIWFRVRVPDDVPPEIAARIDRADCAIGGECQTLDACGAAELAEAVETIASIFRRARASRIRRPRKDRS